MKIEWDFKELYDFADKLNDSYRINTALMTATKEVAKVLHQRLLIMTPVDTGNLRKMWSAGDNLAFTVEPVANGYEVTFVNTATNKRYPSDKYPDGYMYGVAVNDGHKTPSGGWVMGKFFVEAAIAQTGNSKVIERVVMRELQKWWEGCF